MRNYLKRMEREGVQRVKMFLVITAAYGIFWGPLFFVTLVDHPSIGNPTGYEVIKKIAILILISFKLIFERERKYKKRYKHKFRVLVYKQYIKRERELSLY